tara:strand:+ start:30758 stop:31108 length:351 start_codon:yes stop_codon:yes gene_type:complete
MARTTQKTAKNITIDQGSTYSEEFTVTSDGDTAVNITGMTVAAQIRKNYSSANASCNFTTELVTPASGIYRLKLTSAQTAALTDGRYVWDAELTLNDSTLERVHGGIATVTPEVTK